MNNQKYKCKKCGQVISSDELEYRTEESEVGKKPDGTSILDPVKHKNCGGSVDKIEDTNK